jgi:hypothetical protein
MEDEGCVSLGIVGQPPFGALNAGLGTGWEH